MARCKPSGPSPCEVLIVGEAPGKEEDFWGQPFMGSSGTELRRMLNQAGFPGGLNEKGKPDPSTQTYRFTNVFDEQPPKNDLDYFCGKRADVGKEYTLPPLSTGKYVRTEHLGALDQLGADVRATNPRLIIAVGNTPTWALVRRTGIGKLRGSIYPCELDGCQSIPVLPTYHPAAIMRDWSLRVIAVQDLIKARRFLDVGIQQRHRELWLSPTYDEVEDFLQRFIFDNPPAVLSFDIETFAGTITCIGFAPSADRAITIPFYDPANVDRNYWPSAEIEKKVWRLCKEVLESRCAKLGQNGLYDIQYLARCGIFVRNYARDTMIRHHALYPELPKGLGFLASMYTDEAPWKVLRDRNKDNFKLEDE